MRYLPFLQKSNENLFFFYIKQRVHCQYIHPSYSGIRIGLRIEWEGIKMKIQQPQLKHSSDVYFLLLLSDPLILKAGGMPCLKNGATNYHA